MAAAHLGAVEDPLPTELRTRLALPGLGEALARIHQPIPEDDLSLRRALAEIAEAGLRGLHDRCVDLEKGPPGPLATVAGD